MILQKIINDFTVHVKNANRQKPKCSNRTLNRLQFYTKQTADMLKQHC